MNYLTFETDLFFTGIPDDQLDEWFIGADCSGWMYARLLPNSEINHHLGPTMEDWGWIMSVEVKGLVIEICVWEHLDHPNHWILGIAGKKRLLKSINQDLLREAEKVVEVALTAIVQTDARFSNVCWSQENPMEH